MGRLNHLIYIALISYIGYAVLVGAAYPDMPGLCVLTSSIAGVCGVGVVLIAAGFPTVGSWLLLIGSIPLVPLGVLGLIGARKVLDDLSEEKFQKRKEDKHSTTA